MIPKFGTRHIRSVVMSTRLTKINIMTKKFDEKKKKIYIWRSAFVRRLWAALLPPKSACDLIFSLIFGGGDLIVRANSDEGDLILFEVSTFSPPMKVSV